jgi:EAL domain-containing protein (putative c-di-GMP-specific phosphodiesterase class I)/FixJ family two-component response regulator
MLRATDGDSPLVLLVDDDHSGRGVAASVLRDAGLATVEASSGPDALGLLSDLKVAVILVDQTMPGMTGLELTERIRAIPSLRLTPILFLSADDRPDVRLAALRTGATDFMVKPFSFDEMVARVQSQLQICSQWQATVSRLERRAATVAELAAVGSDDLPELAARVICERIARSHSGAGVAIFSWAEGGAALSLLAGSRARYSLTTDPAMAISLRGDGGPWIQNLAHPAGGSSWWACAPLRRGPVPLGVLAIEGRSGTQEELLAAAMDYASTASLHLGPALDESWRSGQNRRAVQRLLKQGAFKAVFQPIIDLGNDHVVGYEGLTRMADGKPILQFLADAEQAQIRAQCELSLLSATLTEASESDTDDAWVSVNLSPSVLVSQSERVADLLDGSDFQLVIELTENERIEDYPAVRKALDDLGDNVKLSVDDTGSGYASLRHVIDLRPHFLKLDRSWVTGLDADDTRQALVAGLVAFCRHTGTELIAEGIEHEPERVALEDLGVTYGQGFLLGRPAALPRPAS